MRAYALSRLAQTVLVVFLSLTAVFVLVRLSGDPVLLFMPMDIQAKDVNEFRQRLGFNDPVPVQYARFVAGAVRGDFGESLRYRRDALGLVLERLPATFLLAATSLLLTMCVAVPLGVLSAVHRNTPLDHAGTVVTVLGQATPGFWLGLMLIYVFSVRLRWLPTGGAGARGRRDHRGDRRVAGARPAHGAGAPEPRLPHRPRRGLRRLGRLYLDQPHGRPPLRVARSAGAAPVSAALRRCQLKAWLGIGLTVAVVVAAGAAPWLAPHHPLATDFAASLSPPGSPGHPLGTHPPGRDLLARVLHGARLALFIG